VTEVKYYNWKVEKEQSYNLV